MKKLKYHIQSSTLYSEGLGNGTQDPHEQITLIVDKINEIIDYLSEHPVRKEGEK